MSAWKHWGNIEEKDIPGITEAWRKQGVIENYKIGEAVVGPDIDPEVTAMLKKQGLVGVYIKDEQSPQP